MSEFILGSWIVSNEQVYDNVAKNDVILVSKYEGFKLKGFEKENGKVKEELESFEKEIAESLSFTPNVIIINNLNIVKFVRSLVSIFGHGICYCQKSGMNKMHKMCKIC